MFPVHALLEMEDKVCIALWDMVITECALEYCTNVILAFCAQKYVCICTASCTDSMRGMGI